MAEKFAAICTMPKSGTWYCHYFFHFLSHLCAGNKNVPLRPREGAFPLPNLGLDGFVVCHAECPSFPAYDGPLRARWEALQYHTEGYNWAAQGFVQCPQFLTQHNSQAKLVYLYRNPLDQTVSFFEHGQKHKDKNVLARPNDRGEDAGSADGLALLPISPNDFFFSHNFDSFLKQYLSWKLSEKIFPNQIKMVSYEDLVRKPTDAFASIVDFMGVNQKGHEFSEHIEGALKLSSKDNIRKYENWMGQSLGRDQTDPNSRHVRDGNIGKWRQHFDEADFKRMCEMFSEWDVSPSEFVFE